jgi:hypothetical protein
MMIVGKRAGQKPPSKYSNFVRPDTTNLLYEKQIDSLTYERRRDKVGEEITLARIELEDSRLDEVDLEGITGFAVGFGERGTTVDCGNA